MLLLQNFSKHYGSIPIITTTNLTLPPAIYWLKGPNGVGKSTFLKSIAGIIHSHGDITAPPVSLRQNPVAYRKRVSFAEAEPLYPEFLTGTNMIGLFTAARPGSPHDTQQRLDQMNMHEYINEPIGTYSSGMQKKLAIVLAFIGNPDIILLDEPLITLDANALDTLSRWITQQHAQHNTTFIIASHQPLALSTAVHTLQIQDHTILTDAQ